MPRCFKKSIVWEFFDKISDGGKITSAKCKLCNTSYKYFGNTTNLHDHLKRKHPIQLTEFQEQQTPNEIVVLTTQSHALAPTRSVPTFSCTSSATTTSSTDQTTAQYPPAPKRVKQMRLYGSTKTSEPSDDERLVFQKDVMRFLAVDCQPLSMVENRGFNYFTKKYIPRHKLPSRKVLSESVLGEVYDPMILDFRSMLDKSNYISLTTDLWSSDSNRCYITITAHFIYDFKTRSLALSTEEVKTDHSAINIGQAILDILSKWQITDKIVTVVTDNAANMKKAVLEHLRKNHHPCVAHTLNLSVQDSIKYNPNLDNLLSKCRSIVTYFKQSNVAAYKLRELQQQMGINELKLKQDVPTRWNSAVVMLERLCKLKLPLSATLSSLVNAPSNLDGSEWEAVDDCIQIFKPVLILTEDLSGQTYSTMSRITPLIRGLQFELKNKSPTTDVGKQLKLNILEITSRRLGFLETTKAVAKATFLDPRFKKAAFGNGENADNAQQWITDELSRLIENQRVSEDVQLPTTSAASSTDTTKDSNGLWGHFDQKVAAITSTTTPTTSAILIIKQYLEMPYFDRKQDPLQFWKMHHSTFPELYTLASKYLNIPATSVPSERIFSKAGMITNLRRNRLDAKRLDQLLFLSENLNLNT